MEQLIGQNMLDGFAMMGYILITGFAVVSITNVLAIAYLMKIHKAIKKQKVA